VGNSCRMAARVGLRLGGRMQICWKMIRVPAIGAFRMMFRAVSIAMVRTRLKISLVVVFLLHMIRGRS
jgi:hypothetical protein